jgi:hypothetical protein
MFTPGSAIDDIAQDDLHRENYVRRLANALISYDRPESLVVEIDGAWEGARPQSELGCRSADCLH